jgi:predicted alpha/beta hydrolase family esterase
MGLKELADFFRMPVDWEKIRQNCRQFVSINSDNDGYIPIEQGYRFRDMLGAELIIEKGQGHFTKILEFPAVLNAILKMSLKKK